MGNNTTKLTITLSPNGNVRVDGPVDQIILCYGLLDAAKDVIRTHAQKKAESLVIPTHPLLPGNGRR